MKRLLIDNNNGQMYTAVTIDGKLREIYIDPIENASIVGHIILGRLDALLPGQFAFVDIGTGKNALMNISAKDQLKKGMPVLVQVYKDPTGSKGAYVGLELRHKGRYVILFKSPRAEIGISKKITNENERKRLRGLVQKVLPKDFSIIIRTNAQGQEADAIISEIEALHLLHLEINQKAKHAMFPSLIYQMGGSQNGQLTSLLSDILSDDISEIWVGNTDFDAVKQSIINIMPALSGRVFHYNQPNSHSLINAHNLPTQIAAALKKTVQLPNGGFITIEQTEACVVIDVNTGRFTGQKDLRTTILETNLEAATCIAWQLMLRNLSGIIIVDFIDMKNEQDKSALLGAFTDEIKNDRIQTDIVGITELGLVQLTRKRTREPLARVLEKDCIHCGGKGRVGK